MGTMGTGLAASGSESSFCMFHLQFAHSAPARAPIFRERASQAKVQYAWELASCQLLCFSERTFDKHFYASAGSTEKKRRFAPGRWHPTTKANRILKTASWISFFGQQAFFENIIPLEVLSSWLGCVLRIVLDRGARNMEYLLDMLITRLSLIIDHR